MRTGTQLRRLGWRRVHRWWRLHHWSVIGALWVAAFILGYAGFSDYLSSRGGQHSPRDTLYLALQLFTLESGSMPAPLGWKLEVARLLAPAVAAYTAVRAVAELFRDELQLARVRVIRDHVIICGLGRKGYLLARGLRESGEQVVVIEQDEGNDLVDLCRELGVIVLLGSATDEAMLVRAGVRRARHLVAVCGDDGANADVAVRALAVAGDRPGRPLTCTVHVVDLQLCRLLRDSDPGTGTSRRPNIRFFNVYDSGAEAMLSRRPPFAEARSGTPGLLVVGLGRFGESLVATAARHWESIRDDEEARLRVTIVDRAAEDRVRSMCFRHPEIAAMCRIEAHAVDVCGSEFHEGAFLSGRGPEDRVSMAYVCLDNDSLALSTALSLRRRLGDQYTPIVVRMKRDEGLARLLHRADGTSAYPGLHVFGLLDATCTPDRVLAVAGPPSQDAREA